MKARPLKILLVEPLREDGGLLAQVRSDSEIEARGVGDGKAAVRVLDNWDADAVLVDFPGSEADSSALDVLSRTFGLPPHPPVLLRLDREAKRTSIQEVTAFLVRGPVDAKMISRAAQFAVARSRVAAKSQTWPLMDAASGLYNRVAFLSMAEQLIRLAFRSTRGGLLFRVKLDNYQEIIDEADDPNAETIVMERIARLFRDTFRESDLIGRVSEDEIWVLGMEVSAEDTAILSARFQESLDRFNVRWGGRVALQVRIGKAFFNPDSPVSLDALLDEARRAMEGTDLEEE